MEALEGAAPFPWLDEPSAIVVWRSLSSCLWGLEWTPVPKTGLQFSSRLDREREYLCGGGSWSVGLPDVANRNIEHPVKLECQTKGFFWYKYVPCNIWDILILKSFLSFIRNSSLTEYPVFYLTHSLGGLLFDNHGPLLAYFFQGSLFLLADWPVGICFWKLWKWNIPSFTPLSRGYPGAYIQWSLSFHFLAVNPQHAARFSQWASCSVGKGEVILKLC